VEFKSLADFLVLGWGFARVLKLDQEEKKEKKKLSYYVVVILIFVNMINTRPVVQVQRERKLGDNQSGVLQTCSP
jgi:hypothetical protein